MSSSNHGTGGSTSNRALRSTRVWLIVAIILVAIWALAGSTAPIPRDAAGDQEGAERVAALVGYIVGSAASEVLIPTLLVWLLLYFGFTRRLAKQRGAAHFVALLITATIVVAPITVLKLIGLMQGAQTSAAVTSIIQEEQARAAAETEVQRAEQARILEGDPFSARALARPGGVSAARVKLAELRKSGADGRASAVESAARLQARVAALPISDRQRVDLLEQHDRGVASGQADARPGLEAAEAVYAALEGQLDVLSRTPRGWVVENGEPAFTSDRDMRDFNAYSRALDAAQARVRAARRTGDGSREQDASPQSQ